MVVFNYKNMAKILDGKIIRDGIREQLKIKFAAQSIKPGLAIIQIGDRPDSEAYIRQKKIFADAVGVHVMHKKFPEAVTQQEVLEEIKKLNNDTSVHGILLQIPIPAHLDKHALLEAIVSVKDVDGLSSGNTQALWEDKNKKTLAAHAPATTRGILTLLDYYEISVEGKNIVVIGKSALVGKPTAVALLNRGATLTVCHKQTLDIKKYTQLADIIVVAAGARNLITQEYINQNLQQVVVDVGINEYSDESGGISARKLTGDVDFKNVEPFVHAITPVPGGVGPMTVASLFENLYDAYMYIIKNNS